MFFTPTFIPHPLICSGHLQTIVGSIWSSDSAPRQTSSHRLLLPDGDAIFIHEDRSEGTEADRVVLFVHGLGGCHASGYVRRTAAKLNARGVGTFRLDLRGHGASARHAKLPGHAGRSEDVASALDFVISRVDGRRVLLVGFSLGANIVLKAAAESAGRANSPAAVLAVAPPIDLALCAASLQQGFNRLYDRVFVRAALARVKELVAAGVIDGPLLHPEPRRLLDFDDRFTAPRSGFLNAADYYARSASGPLLSCITAPTTIVAAEDDPIIPVRMFSGLNLPESVRLVMTRHGGHLGYIGRGGQDPDRRWLDWRIVEWALNVV